MDPFQSTFPSSKVSIYMYEFFGNLPCKLLVDFFFAARSFLMGSRFRSRNHELLLGYRVRSVTSLLQKKI